MSDLIKREDAITVVHKKINDILNELPTHIDEDGFEVFDDQETVYSLLRINKAISQVIKSLQSVDAVPVGENLDAKQYDIVTHRKNLDEFDWWRVERR
jgi:hypothetical protein